jgi:hypothetical protein
MQNHAIAMSYDSTVHYLVKRLPANLDGLKRILLHNSYYIPAAFDFAKHQVKYTASYLDVNNKSTVNPDRIVWNSYPLNSRDIDILKGYGCASSDNYASISTNATLSDAKRLFRINNDYERVIVNWQSRFVVDDLAKKTIQSLSTKNYDYLYLDDLSRNPADCVNKGYGGKGSYISWKEGQLAFLQKVTTAAHAMTGRQGGQIKVFGNLWSPYASPDIVKWYTDKKLRLDHYYFESAGYATADLLHGQVANGIDPETGLPAFEPLAGVFIPANLVSLCTRNEHMIALSSSAASQGKLNDYLSEHFDVAGVAASQGSWFGWVGETSLDQLGFDGKLIHSNAMQLLRAIPNWENLAKVPLSSRRFNKFNNVYVSPNSNFNNEVVQGHNPINNEIYVVFMTIAGRADIKVKNIATASFVNSYFNKTGEDALPCLLDFNDKAILKCVDKVGNGIRITLK